MSRWNPANIARETLRQFATHCLAPISDNYRDLYHRIAGPAGGEEEQELLAKLSQFAGQLAKMRSSSCAIGLHGLKLSRKIPIDWPSSSRRRKNYHED